MRDAGFSRQRYWGEPFPMTYKDGIPTLLNSKELPVELPTVESYKPTGDGQSPLANNADWANISDTIKRETDTMPGFAGSSWYYLRYMDPNNADAFVAPSKEQYWQQVDLYVGGAEHAVGHLMYSRFWHKFLQDRGFVSTPEPFKKLINQGMIQGRSSLAYRIKDSNQFVSHGLKDQYDTTPIHVDITLVKDDVLDVEGFKNWRADFKNATFLLEDDKYVCGSEVEKMSKSKYNVVNPDDVIAQYGADCFRMYEMFLGPIEQHKPWDTKGIDGVSKFLRKLWRLFYNNQNEWIVDTTPASKQELKVLHKTIQKIQEDIENFSLNTSVSAFMVCVNELGSLTCHKKEVLEPLLILLAPFAPFITEEIWETMGNTSSIHQSHFPTFNASYLVEASHEYPVSINGKMRAKISLPTGATKEIAEQAVLSESVLEKWIDGKNIKKLIFVPGKIINVVI